jgi:glycosyltransferase involved in cell wall biosynthesis
MAETLKAEGHEVEVFTTCAQSESAWANDLPEGTTDEGGLRLHRFRVDPCDRDRHLATVQEILHSNGGVSPDLEVDYLAHSVHSKALLEALKKGEKEFDEVLVGPYLFGLTHDVAAILGDKVMLVPCFHDEPLARLQVWPKAFSRVGGILYHSAQEQEFAQAELGLNHPRAACVQTWIDAGRQGDARRGRELAGCTGPYVLYCGRYSPEKNLPRLLDYARRYEEGHPGRFRFVFAGAGQLGIPEEPWACDLGFVTEHAKRDLLCGASALVQLSNYESLSLVALEAWAQETPVLVNRNCTVLNAQVELSHAGTAIGCYEEFAAALHSLWQNPKGWKEKGRRGRAYVQQRFSDRHQFAARLTAAMHSLGKPLRDCMVERGLNRGRCYSRTAWREGFGNLIERLLDQSKKSHTEKLVIIPRNPELTVSAGLTTGLIPVRICNQGTLPALASGPARWQLSSQVFSADGSHPESGPEVTPLPCLLAPTQEASAVVKVTVPAKEGSYVLKLGAVRNGATTAGTETTCTLIVDARTKSATGGSCISLLHSMASGLAEAANRAHLPDDYLDVTEGRFASWKRLIKRKLLGNFKHAYVDVISRQQSAFNRHLVAIAQDLAECCATLNHAQAIAGAAENQSKLKELAQRIDKLANELDRCCRSQELLENRIMHLEKQIGAARKTKVPGSQ